MTEDEFWSLAPREFRALADRHREKQDVLDYRAGVTTAVMANMWGKKSDGQAYQPSDFFSSLASSQTNPAGVLSEEQIKKQVQNNIAAMQEFTRLARFQGLSN